MLQQQLPHHHWLLLRADGFPASVGVHFVAKTRYVHLSNFNNPMDYWSTSAN
ncbi:hypothetical protein KFK09_000306 [Dendrobium nobile]|uniref:Uncharacterized protein n=1 Tax=Dendrobium nobile TaxID=94219 RepID=A0A8T3C8A2_DENNO|nr:hypothetical protein KFK09_000306 [Dendrobium nobile]